MLVRASLWREIGSFDVRYSPGYYEGPGLRFRSATAGLSGRVPTTIGRRALRRRLPWTRCHDGSQAVPVHQPTRLPGQVVRPARERAGRSRRQVPRARPKPGNAARARHRSRRAEARLRRGKPVHGFVRETARRRGLPRHLRRGRVRAAGAITQSLQQYGVEVLYGRRCKDGIAQWIVENGRYFDLVYLHKWFVAAKYVDLLREHSGARIVCCPPICTTCASGGISPSHGTPRSGSALAPRRRRSWRCSGRSTSSTS